MRISAKNRNKIAFKFMKIIHLSSNKNGGAGVLAPLQSALIKGGVDSRFIYTHPYIKKLRLLVTLKKKLVTKYCSPKNFKNWND